MSDQASCRSCSAPILWVVNAKTGTREPLDAGPAADGNIEIIERLRDEEGREQIMVRHLLKGERESETLFDPPARYVSHFTSCPNAATHRRRA